jgi:GTP-binding protein HflX
MLVFNKIDRGGDEKALRRKYPKAITLSARSEADIKRLRDAIVAIFEKRLVEAELFLPWAAQNQRGEIFASCKVLEERSDEAGAFLRVRGEPEAVERLAKQFAAPAKAKAKRKRA